MTRGGGVRFVSVDVQIVDVSQVGRAWDSRRTVSRGDSGKRMPLPPCILATITSGRDLDVTPGSSGPDPVPMIGTVAVPAVESVEAVKRSSPPLSGQLSPASPQTVAWEEMGDSSVPLSPNRVQAGHSQDVPEEGSLFHVSPVSPGFLMRPSGAAEQFPQAGVLLPTTLDDFSDSILGDPITYAQCEQILGSDAHMTLPVYTLPSGLAYMPGQSSVQTVLVSAISSRPEVGSSAFAPPMDTEGSPLLATGLPGCPYRFTSYSGPAFSDVNPAFGCNSIIRGSWSSSVRRSRLACCTVRRRFGWISLERNRRWQLQSTCNGMRALCYPIFR